MWIIKFFNLTYNVRLMFHLILKWKITDAMILKDVSDFHIPLCIFLWSFKDIISIKD